MSRESRIANLNAVAEEKKQECLERTDKAISSLIKKNERISFGSVALVAGVSISYLYKYSEIKERIQDLREQQKKRATKPNKPQTASEKSKQAIIDQFRNRIKTLEGERKEQEKKIQVMTGRLYELGINLDLVDRLKAENFRLNEENEQLRADLEFTHNNLKIFQQRLENSKPKITTLNKKSSKQPINENISDALKMKFHQLGIRLNEDLNQLIKSATEPQIINALSVVKEALASGSIRSKVGLFRKALEKAWEPNESDSEREANGTKLAFSKWYALAYNYGIVIGSREENGIIMVLENTGQWCKFEDFSSKWTLDYLKQWQSRNR